MAQRNTERLLNLVIALLATPRYISREQIRDLVAGYAQAKTDEAFQRMFERDKEDLRRMGVEIQVGPTDPTTMETDGYRIRADDFYLPEIELTPQESTLVGLASSVWNESVLAHDVGQAIAKLRASGTEISPEPYSFLAPRLTVREPGFDILWEALVTRAPVGFTYHGRLRRVRPWRMISRSGAWYLLGEDENVGTRMFKLSRIEDQPQIDGEPGSYELPEPETIQAACASLEPTPIASVCVAVREGAAGNLRRRGTPVPGETLVGYELVSIPYARPDEIVSTICAAGPDAVVATPGEIRDQVIAQLRGVAEGGTR